MLSFSDAFPQLFPRWDQGWLTPLPTSDLLHLLWAFTLRGRGQQGHVCASYVCHSKMLDRVELPFQQTAPLLPGQRSFLGAVFRRPQPRLCVTDRASVTFLLYF